MQGFDHSVTETSKRQTMDKIRLDTTQTGWFFIHSVILFFQFSSEKLKNVIIWQWYTCVSSFIMNTLHFIYKNKTNLVIIWFILPCKSCGMWSAFIPGSGQFCGGQLLFYHIATLEEVPVIKKDSLFQLK